MMKITVTTLSDHMFTLEVGEDLELINFKALCEAESRIPLDNILLILEGRPLVNDSKTLKDLRMKDGDVVMIHYDAPSSISRPRPSTTSTSAGGDDDDDDELEFVRVDTGSGSTSLVVVESTSQGEDVPDSATTRAEDCKPGTSQGAKEKEDKLKKMASGKQDASTAMLPEASGFNELSYGDELSYLQYYKDTGFTKGDLTYLKNFNPAFADIVVKAQEGEMLVPGSQEDEDMAMAIRLSIAMMKGATGERASDSDHRETGMASRPYVDCQINGCKVKAYLSTKIKLSILTSRIAEKCRIMDMLQYPEDGRPYIPGTKGLKYFGYIEEDIELGAGGERMRTTFHVYDQLETEMVLGLDWLNAWQCELSFIKNELYISLNELRIPFVEEPASVREKEKRGHGKGGDGDGAAGGSPSVRKSRGRGRRQDR